MNIIDQFVDWGSFENGLSAPLYNFILYDVNGEVLCRPIWDNEEYNFY